MTLITADDIERDAAMRSAAARNRRKPGEIPRCYCGCRKPALWPRSGRPYFHTRKCGYLMALRMVKQRPL